MPYYIDIVGDGITSIYANNFTHAGIEAAKLLKKKKKEKAYILDNDKKQIIESTIHQKNKKGYLLPVGHFVRGYGWIGKVLEVDENGNIMLAKPIVSSKEKKQKNIPARDKAELIAYVRDIYNSSLPIRHTIPANKFLYFF